MKLGMYTHSIPLSLRWCRVLQSKSAARSTRLTWIVPDTKFEDLLGANYWAAFRVKPFFHRNKVELGCVKGRGNQRVPAYQTVDMWFKGGNMKSGGQSFAHLFENQVS